MAEPLPAPEGEALPAWEVAADQAIKACGCDARAAVIALLIMNDALERELDLTRVAVSAGFSRGWHHRRAAGAKDDGGS
jgi:hypothetical protein